MRAINAHPGDVRSSWDQDVERHLIQTGRQLVEIRLLQDGSITPLNIIVEAHGHVDPRAAVRADEDGRVLRASQEIVDLVRREIVVKDHLHVRAVGAWVSGYA